MAADNDYPVWGTLATVLDGVSLTMLGDTEEGMRRTEAGIELYQGLTTPPVFWPLLLHLRGMAHGMAGDPRRGVELLEEAIAVVGRPGGFAPPEFHISMGDLLSRLPEPDVRRRRRPVRDRGAGVRLHGPASARAPGADPHRCSEP